MFDQFFKLLDVFEKSGIDNPLNETLKVFNVLTNHSLSKADFQGLHFEGIAEQRLKGIPVEYILGMGSFYGQSFFCSPDTLIPRTETELLVETVIGKIKQVQSREPLCLVDMGTGSGSVAVSIALHTEDTTIYASDLKAETVAVARMNVEKFNLEDRIILLQGDLFEPYTCYDLAQNIDMVVCNPPYIPATSIKKMASEIIDYEPEAAFNGGAFGIEFFRRLIRGALIFLKPGGLMYFEIGEGQEKLVDRLFQKIGGYDHVEFVDNGDAIRVIGARKKGHHEGGR